MWQREDDVWENDEAWQGWLGTRQEGQEEVRRGAGYANSQEATTHADETASTETAWQACAQNAAGNTLEEAPCAEDATLAAYTARAS